MRRLFKVLAWVVGSLVGVWVLMLLLSFVLVAASGGFTAAAKATPPKGMTNITEYLAWLKTPLSVYRAPEKGTNYYVLTGPSASPVPSGPSVFAFNAEGQYVGWCPNLGDVPLPHEISNSYRDWVEITTNDLPLKMQ